MSRSSDLVARREAVVARGVAQFVGPVTAVSGSGAMLTDADGKPLLDFGGGIGVLNAGHCAQRVVEAIRNQAGRLIHASIHVATYEPYVALCEKLVALFPHGDSTKAMLVNSGAEAVENAIKIARQSTGRRGVICFTESFHGRTLLCATLTSKVGYKAGCGPFAPEVYRLPYPNHFRYGSDLDEQRFAQRELERLEQAFVNVVSAEDVAAIILEVVQGEGGFAVAPPPYLEGLRRVCDRHGIVLIFDEIQSGFCRTGRWAAYQHFDVTPDLSTWAKSMGGGMPISAVVGRAEVMDAARPGTLGGTYGGNPVACAAALATIETMEALNLNQRAAAIGRRVRRAFEALRQECSAVADVRGLGAMVAVEFVEDRGTRRPATELVRSVIAGCVRRGLLVLPAGSSGNIIRVLVPLVVQDADLDRGLAILHEEVVRAAAGDRPGAAPAAIAAGSGRGTTRS
jgi:4-aminobutyrate aminotransferase/(S)-3-amino-2-methylpropionate transaminase